MTILGKGVNVHGGGEGRLIPILHQDEFRSEGPFTLGNNDTDF